jgi:membrane-associated phospholipid phosphatase
MGPAMPSREPARAAESGRPTELEGVLRALAGIFALQDVLLLVYLGLTGLMVWSAPSPSAPAQAHCARVIYVSMAAHAIGCFLARGRPRLPVLLRAAIYRCSIVGVLVSSYLTLRDTLTLVRPDSLDDVLVRIDLRLFGVEPALWLERYNQRPVVEWFSFFYFSYFFICTAYMLTVVWLTPPARRTTEFAVGTLLVYTVGQLGYTAVPGYGPVAHLRDQFHGDVAGGFFWSCVWSTVQAGGAMKDIFPSLHTAGPSWFTLFALHQSRSDPRWRWPARITGFFAINIIVSTMLLRWHYGIDVVAGLALALTAGLLAPRLAAIEESWRRSMGFPGPWTFVPAE